VNPEAMSKTADLGNKTQKFLVKAVLIYEDFEAGVRGRWFCQRLPHALGCRLKEEMWNFDVLGIREVRNAAAGSVRRAHIVIVSVSGRRDLPKTILIWFEMWLWLLRNKKKPALVALFPSIPSHKSASTRSYLRSLAERRGIDFFPFEVS
jgi:hypothetical protein